MGEAQAQATGRMVLRAPKEGERILAPTRRPDGTLRKPVRIRAGYVPQDEVAIYQSKGALMKKSQPDVPPGYDPDAAPSKPKTKSAKRNERKKEKKLQAALVSSDDKGKNLDVDQAEKAETEITAEEQHRTRSLETVTDQINNLSVSSTLDVASPSDEQSEASKTENSGIDIDKRIRALKKKIRLAEAQLKGDQKTMKPEQLEKIAKLEGWHQEVKDLEDKKANGVS